MEQVWNLYQNLKHRSIYHAPVETYPEDWFNNLDEALDWSCGLAPVLEARKKNQKLRFLVGYSNTHGGGSSVSYFETADEIEQRYPDLKLKEEYVETQVVVATNKYGDVNRIDVYWVEE